jgi:hypothetical protein
MSLLARLSRPSVCSKGRLRAFITLHISIRRLTEHSDIILPPVPVSPHIYETHSGVQPRLRCCSCHACHIPAVYNRSKNMWYLQGNKWTWKGALQWCLFHHPLVLKN